MAPPKAPSIPSVRAVGQAQMTQQSVGPPKAEPFSLHRVICMMQLSQPPGDTRALVSLTGR